MESPRDRGSFMKKWTLLLVAILGGCHQASVTPTDAGTPHICPAVFEQSTIASPPARSQRLASSAVGVTSDDYVDKTRSTPANGAEPEHPNRDLPAEVWYPAQGDS